MADSALPARDPRAVLGVGPADDLAAVRRAYRRLVLEYHPDRNPSEKAAARFRAATEAYLEIKRALGAPSPAAEPGRRESVARRARSGEPPILSWRNVESNLHFCLRGLGRLVRKAIDAKAEPRR